MDSHQDFARGVVAIFVGLATIECDGLMAILRGSLRWPLPKTDQFILKFRKPRQ
jgi:hypothetical protein